MKENNIIKELQLGATTVKFCNDFIANTEEERKQRIINFKQASLNLINNVKKGGNK